MNKQELLDKAVHELKGVLPASHHESHHLYTNGSKYILGIICDSDRDIAELNEWNFVCSQDQFQQRARELGYVNGYRWGVEYPANGKKPDLADDVTINGEYESIPIDDSISIEVKNAAWGSIYKFKITDQRYKPADTSYLDKQAVETISLSSTEWYDYETQKALRLPPVGVEFEVFWPKDTDPKWNKGVVSHSSSEHLILTFDDGEENYYHSTDIEKNKPEFRPFDWNRKAEAERKRVVDAVYALDELSLSRGDLEFLYDKGCLRLPADKS